ncbi:MAG TPA: DinB family protein [Thermoanaerobaculia bacterium]|nr:DinB family protein [Thermoanaerobaculia bacterium]
MKRSVLALLALALPTFVFAAQVQNAPRAEGAKVTGFRAEFLANLDEVQGKITDLANAVPAEKYGWRPAPDVRSISEVFMHVAGGNYFLATFVGTQPPADMPKDLEKITDKAKVVAELKRSFDHIRAVVAKTSDADLEKKVKVFGNDTTYRGVFMTMLSHLHEHLGQSIAYARSNGVVPPWSR